MIYPLSTDCRLHKITYGLLACLLLFALCCSPAYALERGRIEGRIVDRDLNVPISYAHLVLLGERYGGMTLTDGTYRIVAIPAGTYSVKVVMDGYEPQVADSVRVAEGMTTQLDFQLVYGDTLQMFDCTEGVSSHCEVYDAEKLETIMVIRHHPVPYSEYLSEGELKEYNAAREELFPHCDWNCLPELHGGRRIVRLFLCPECCAARAEWLEKHKEIQKAIARAQRFY